MITDPESRRLAWDVIRMLNAPFGTSKPVESPPAETVDPETFPSSELAQLFKNQTLEARYSVYQLIGRRVLREGDAFILDRKSYSHSWDADPVRNFLLDTYPVEMRNLDHAKLKLLESKKSDENLMGVVSLHLDRFEGNSRLIIFGHFSLESRAMSAQASVRTNGENSIYYVLKGNNPTGLENLLSGLVVNNRSHEAALNNRDLIVQSMSQVFPDIVMSKVDSHMLRELAVLKIFDRRK